MSQVARFIKSREWYGHWARPRRRRLLGGGRRLGMNETLLTRFALLVAIHVSCSMSWRNIWLIFFHVKIISAYCIRSTRSADRYCFYFYVSLRRIGVFCFPWQLARMAWFHLRGRNAMPPYCFHHVKVSWVSSYLGASALRSSIVRHVGFLISMLFLAVLGYFPPWVCLSIVN